jgi:hypothetical protein
MKIILPLPDDFGFEDENQSQTSTRNVIHGNWRFEANEAAQNCIKLYLRDKRGQIEQISNEMC